jgi:hypothetical protein
LFIWLIPGGDRAGGRRTVTELVLSNETINDLRAITNEENRNRPEVEVTEEDILDDFIDQYWNQKATGQ